MPRMAIYFAFLICLAVAFTPTMDSNGRVFAAIMSVPLLATTIYHAYVEILNAYPKMPGQHNSNQ